MGWVIAPPKQASVAVEGTEDRFPVRRIFCVGRNYAAHVRELGNDERDPPFFFTKPADAVADSGATLAYPPETQDLHHEVELVVAIGLGGVRIPASQVRAHLWGAAVGIDLTRRDLQLAARDKGRPWDWGKAFDRSAPVGPLLPMARGPSLERGRIGLAVNGSLRQEADLAEMIWPVAEQVAILSRSIRLAPGDLVMTGTPAGVGPLVPGDRVEGFIDGLPGLAIAIGPRE